MADYMANEFYRAAIPGSMDSIGKGLRCIGVRLDRMASALEAWARNVPDDVEND